MKMSYQRTVSNKEPTTGEINTQRFYAEQEIKTDGLEPLAKQKLMIDTAKELHVAGAIMLREMIIGGDK